MHTSIRTRPNRRRDRTLAGSRIRRRSRTRRYRPRPGLVLARVLFVVRADRLHEDFADADAIHEECLPVLRFPSRYRDEELLF